MGEAAGCAVAETGHNSRCAKSLSTSLLAADGLWACSRLARFGRLLRNLTPHAWLDAFHPLDRLLELEYV